ncbi:Lipase, member I [Apodemus speciosus]|uniref:Lipase, member I n=1 Tax=Apodemus speciosus TaxID=105296 RepID=A0ABQ0FMA6_APOSI
MWYLNFSSKNNGASKNPVGNAKCAEPLFESNNSLNTRFNPSKKTVWVIHGYRPLGSTPAWLHKFTTLLLKEEDVNLIVVDWNQGATTFIYNRAVRNTRKVAEILRESIENLLTHGASLDNFHFIGMSLGAHISGFVGKIFHGQLGRITDKYSLDPAGPRFSGKPSNSRLDYTDAKFVDVIHSDSKGLGILEPSGHIDFYPNGGRKQPGCPTSIFSGMNYIKCDHQRAVYLFLATFETNCNFVSFPCRSYKDYKNGLCVDCGNFYKDSCPRLDRVSLYSPGCPGTYAVDQTGLELRNLPASASQSAGITGARHHRLLSNQAKLWKEELKKKTEGWPLRTIAFLDTSSQNPFCTYYFTLHIVALSETMRNGSISFGLLNDLGVLEYPRLYKKSKPFANLQEVKILAQFLNDVKRAGLPDIN